MSRTSVTRNGSPRTWGLTDLLHKEQCCMSLVRVIMFKSYMLVKIGSLPAVLRGVMVSVAGTSFTKACKVSDTMEFQINITIYVLYISHPGSIPTRTNYLHDVAHKCTHCKHAHYLIWILVQLISQVFFCNYIFEKLLIHSRFLANSNHFGPPPSPL